MTMKCPMCGSEELDGPRRIGTSNWGLQYRVKEWSWFCLPSWRVPVRRAWACLDCGHVMLAVDPEELASKLARHGRRE